MLVVCDGCGTPHDRDRDQLALAEPARGSALRHGWLVRDGAMTLDLCPDCR